ncbi:MAG: hypothetical protein KatS3mg101_0336 [Patescibacteria group bacterium]|nr:MAG: hypothetical protein KatS3mg101_0336 [Patescibacteria group bacterium]
MIRLCVKIVEKKLSPMITLEERLKHANGVCKKWFSFVKKQEERKRQPPLPGIK